MAVVAIAAALAAADPFTAAAPPYAHAQVGAQPAEILAVADTGNDRIQLFEPGGSTFARKFGSEGSSDGQFSSPVSVDMHPYGIIAVADSDNHNVQVFYPNGTHAFTIGTTGTAGCGDGRLNGPAGVAFAADGRIAVANTFCNDIRVYDPDGELAFKGGAATD